MLLSTGKIQIQYCTIKKIQVRSSELWRVGEAGQGGERGRESESVTKWKGGGERERERGGRGKMEGEREKGGVRERKIFKLIMRHNPRNEHNLRVDNVLHQSSLRRTY